MPTIQGDYFLGPKTERLGRVPYTFHLSYVTQYHLESPWISGRHRCSSGTPTSAPPSSPRSISACSRWSSRTGVDCFSFLHHLSTIPFHPGLLHTPSLSHIVGCVILKACHLSLLTRRSPPCFPQHFCREGSAHLEQLEHSQRVCPLSHCLSLLHALGSTSRWFFWCYCCWWVDTNLHEGCFVWLFLRSRERESVTNKMWLLKYFLLNHVRAKVTALIIEPYLFPETDYLHIA